VASSWTKWYAALRAQKTSPRPRIPIPFELFLRRPILFQIVILRHQPGRRQALRPSHGVADSRKRNRGASLRFNAFRGG
jgi:hypothetical protein